MLFFVVVVVVDLLVFCLFVCITPYCITKSACFCSSGVQCKFRVHKLALQTQIRLVLKFQFMNIYNYVGSTISVHMITIQSDLTKCPAI